MATIITIGIRDKREALDEFEYVTAAFSWEDNMIQRGEGEWVGELWAVIEGVILWSNQSKEQWLVDYICRNDNAVSMIFTLRTVSRSSLNSPHISSVQCPSYSQSIN